jgi:hypothetical protein
VLTWGIQFVTYIYGLNWKSDVEDAHVAAFHGKAKALKLLVGLMHLAEEVSISLEALCRLC